MRCRLVEVEKPTIACATAVFDLNLNGSKVQWIKVCHSEVPSTSDMMEVITPWVCREATAACKVSREYEDTLCLIDWVTKCLDQPVNICLD